MTCARREAGARTPAPSTSAGAPRRADARPGRARARLSLLPALALLLGAPGLFTPAPAQAQTTVWSATLTVGQVEENALGSRVGCNYQEPCASRLSDDDFEVGGAAYTVRGVWAFTGGTMDGALEVRFSENPNAALEALNFCVGSTAYPLAGATSRFYRWPAGPDWTAGDRVALSIAATCGATTPVMPPVTTPEVGFELGSYSAAEHLGEIAAALTLSSALSQASTVTVSVKAGATATSGTDFTAPASIALPAGTTYVVFTVPVTDDSEVEQDETFTLVLSAVQNAPYTVSTAAGEATFQIDDDDWAPPTGLTVSAGTGKLDLSWTASPDFGIGLGSSYTVQHRKSSVTNDAVTGDADTGWVENTGVTGTSYSITGLDAGAAYDVRVRLARGTTTSAWAAGSGTLGSGPPTAVTLRVDNSNPAEGETVTVTAELDQPAPRTYTVPIVFTLPVGGVSSTASNDDITVGATMAIQAGERTATTTIAIVDDADEEPEETIAISLNAATIGLLNLLTPSVTNYGAGVVVTIQASDQPAPPPPSGAVWSATLTVGAVPDNVLGNRVGCNYERPCASRLTDDDFEIGGAAYTVRGVWAFTGGTMDGALEVRFSENPNAALEALNFCVGGTAYPLAGATSRFYRWSDVADPGWSAGDRVALSIAATCSGTTPVTPVTPSVPQSVTVTPLAHSDGTPALRVTFTNPETSAYPYSLVQVRPASATGAWPAQSGGHSLPAGAEADTQGTNHSPVFIVSGLSPGVEYAVRLHFVDNNLDPVAASSAPVRATTWNVPGAPTSVDPTAGDASLSVTWAAPTSTGGTGASITGYKVRWRVKDANPNTQGNQPGNWNNNAGVDADDSTARTHAIASLTNGAVYEVEVRALNGINPGSAWSAAGEGTPAAAPPPSGPVWSATLTAVETSTNEFGCDGQSGCNTALTDNSFRVGGTDYAFEGIYDQSGGNLFLDLTATPNDALKALKFCVGTTAYSLSSPLSSLYTFTNVNLSWSAGDTISLSIGSSCAGTTPPVLSTDATLSALTATNALSASGVFTAFTLAPAFAAATETYSATVPNNITHVKLTPTVTATGKATVKVGKAGSLQSVNSGSASQAIALAEGANAILVEVTAQDTITKKTYRVNITRRIHVAVPTIASIDEGDAQLVVNFSAAAGTTAAFVRHREKTPQGTAAWTTARVSASDAAAGKLTLSSLVNGTTYEVQMRSSAMSGGSTVYSGWSGSSEGTPVAPPAAAAVWSATLMPKDFGSIFGIGCSNNVFTVADRCITTTRLSEDQVTIGGATFNVERIVVFSGSLILQLNKTISDTLKTYNFCVGTSSFALSSATLSNVGTIVNSLATWTNTGLTWTEGTAVSLSIASSCGGTTPPAQSTDATLSGLTATSSDSASGTFGALTLTPVFAAATTGYSASVANSITHVKLTPTVNHANATVEVGKQGQTLAAVSSATASAAIALSEGANPITVKVTAEDGTSTETYTVTVTRAAAAALSLSGLSLSAGGVAVPLTPAFSGSTTSYTASVASSVTTLSLTPTWTGDHTVSAGSADPPQDNIFTSLNQNQSTTSGASLDVTLASSGDTLVFVVLEEGNPPANEAADIEYLITVSKQAAPPPMSAAALVSNIGQGRASGFSTSGVVSAQAFTTGSATGGYTLTSIEAVLGSTPSATQRATIRAELWSAAAGGGPGSKIADLTVPSNAAAGTVTFAAPANTALAASTTYFYIPYTTGSLNLNLGNTNSDNEDSGGQTGWSIADNYYWQNGNSPVAANFVLNNSVNTPVHAIRVNGAAASGSGQQQGPDGRLGPALTAAFEDVPAEHDGEAAFALLVGFSDVLGDGGAPPTAASFAVTGGKVKRVKQVGAGLWRVRVKPDSWRDVELTLAGGRACGEDGAVCAADGRALFNTASVTVGGPVRLRVEGGRAREGRDESLDFTVSLSRAARDGVSVDYETADGTATAGEDYTAVSGTLVFPPGETEQTVAVAILDDAIDEGRETFFLRLSNPQGAYLRNIHREAKGVIVNDDPLQKAWLSRFGRTVGSQVTDAVSERLAGGLAPGVHVTLAGQALDLTRTDGGPAQTEEMTGLARAFGALASNDGDAFARHGPGGMWDDSTATTAGHAMTGRELLLGTSFHLATEGEGPGPGFAAWGRTALGRFDGEAPADPGSLRISGGEVLTGVLGMDAEWDSLLAGVAVSLSEGEGRYDNPGMNNGSGRIESTMTTVSPYLRFRLTGRVSAWGLAGWGTGDMTITPDAGPATKTGLSMRLGALGARGALLEPGGAGGLDLALKADAFFVRTEWDKVSNETDTAADASRVRMVLEGGRRFALSDTATLRSSLELGLRHDGGDAETGTGVEVGGGVSYADAASGLSVEARARMLVAHADDDYEEWGASATVRLAPGERGRGLSFSFAPTIGATSSATGRLWGAQDAHALAPDGDFEAARGLRAEMGYGMALSGDRFTATPNLGFGLSDGGARDWRIGWRLSPAIERAPGFEVSLDATRSEPANGGDARHGVTLGAGFRW